MPGLLKRLKGGRAQKALGSQARLTTDTDESVQAQLIRLMDANMARVIDLFRDWDENGDGNINLKEFRAAVKALGYEGPRRDVDALFRFLDKDGSGSMDFAEFRKALRKGAEQLEMPSRKEEDADEGNYPHGDEELLPEEFNAIAELEAALSRSEDAKREAFARQTALEEENKRLVQEVREAADERSKGVRQLAALARTMAVSEAQLRLEIQALQDKYSALQDVVNGRSKGEDETVLQTEVKRLRSENRTLTAQLAVLSDSLYSSPSCSNKSPSKSPKSPKSVDASRASAPSSSMPSLAKDEAKAAKVLSPKAAVNIVDPTTPRSDVETARREKAEARAQAKADQQAKIAEENRELARRKAAASGRTSTLTEDQDGEAIRAELAAKRQAEREARNAEIAAANREQKKRLDEAGPAIDNTLF